jgi:hypothetical protein
MDEAAGNSLKMAIEASGGIENASELMREADRLLASSAR